MTAERDDFRALRAEVHVDGNAASAALADLNRRGKVVRSHKARDQRRVPLSRGVQDKGNPC